MAVMAAAMICLAGCGGSTPSKSVKSFFTAFAAKNEAEMAKHSDSTTAKKLAGMHSMLSKEQIEQMKKIEIVKETIDGDTAVVTIRLDGDEEEVEMIKVDGVWRVDPSSF